RLHCPDRRLLLEYPGAHLMVCAVESFGVDRVGIAIVVDQPVAAPAALGTAPLLIREPFGVEVQADGSDVGLFLAPEFPQSLRSVSSLHVQRGISPIVWRLTCSGGSESLLTAALPHLACTERSVLRP